MVVVATNESHVPVIEMKFTLSRPPPSIASKLLAVATVCLAPNVAFGFADCGAAQAVEPLYHQYRDLIEPRSETYGLRTAERLRLEFQSATSTTILQLRGFRPDQAETENLAPAVDAMNQLVDHWLSGAPLTRRIYRKHARIQEEMRETLVATDCFENDLRRVSDPQHAPPSSAEPNYGSDFTPRSGAFGAVRDMLADPPPPWLIAVYLASLIALAAGILAARIWWRQFERRGFPRYIHTGNMTLATENGEIEVATADIGRGGAKIRAHENLRQTRRVEVVFGDLRIAALLTWENAHFAGLTFVKPISRVHLKAIRNGTVE